jgi:2-methylcitrate dehydratase PrpD
MGLDTGRLAKHIHSYGGSPIDAKAFEVAKQCVLDWYGVAIAGSNELVARLVREECVPMSSGVASVIGSTKSCRPADAALANGTASHALDYDDVHPAIGHPTAAIFPAALAIGEDLGCNGQQLLRAFIAGYETAGYIGTILAKSHYERGFHTTATLGSFGAAAAASILLGLAPDVVQMALGLAGTQAAGLKSMFGTMAKPFHAGKAAANGVVAARLAAAGFTANPNVLEAEQGFAAVMSDIDPKTEYSLPERGGMVVDTLFKYHAACYLTHSSIEALGRLMERNAISPKQIVDVELHVPRGHLSVCNIPFPKNGLQSKFSLRHTAALAISGKDTAAIATFSDELANDTQLVSLRERVTVYGDRTAGFDAHVVVKVEDGRMFEAEADVGVPDKDLDRQHKRLDAKFESLARPVIGVERSSKLKQAIADLVEAPDLLALALH